MGDVLGVFRLENRLVGNEIRGLPSANGQAEESKGNDDGCSHFKTFCFHTKSTSFIETKNSWAALGNTPTNAIIDREFVSFKRFGTTGDFLAQLEKSNKM